MKRQSDLKKWLSNVVANYWLFGISLFLLGFSIALNINQSTISNEGVVLTFVGILATFIVIGNYAQAIEIKNSFKGSIDSLNNRLDGFKAIDESANRRFEALIGGEVERIIDEYNLGGEVFGLLQLRVYAKMDDDYAKMATLEGIKSLSSNIEARKFDIHYVGTLFLIIIDLVNPGMNNSLFIKHSQEILKIMQEYLTKSLFLKQNFHISEYLLLICSHINKIAFIKKNELIEDEVKKFHNDLFEQAKAESDLINKDQVLNFINDFDAILFQHEVVAPVYSDPALNELIMRE